MIKWPTRLGTLAVGGALIAGGILATASDAGAATPACGNGSLAVTRAPSQGAAGHGAFWVLFRNASHTTCSLRGYPGLDALDSHGNVLAHAQRTLSGYMGGPGVVNTVLVAPGGFASATVEWLNFNPSNGTNCRFSTSVATTPPNTTHTVHLPVSVSICSCVSQEGRATNDPPWPQGLLPSKCTGPAMRLQPTVDQTPIRGLVTPSDRCSSGGFPMSRERASIEIGHLPTTFWGSPTVTSPPALCTLCCC